MNGRASTLGSSLPEGSAPAAADGHLGGRSGGRRRRLVALALGVPIALCLLALGLPVPGTPGRPDCVNAASIHHAAVVVEHGGGAVTARCVGFDSDRITGEQLLSLSGIPYQTADFGSLGRAVCQIEAEPSTYPASCWTTTSSYWAMFVGRGGGGWAGSSLGISAQSFADGDAEGFRYNPQNGSGGVPASPAGVCAPASAVPVAPAPPPGSASIPRTRAPKSPSAPASGSHAAGAVGGAAAPPSRAGVATPPASASISARLGTTPRPGGISGSVPPGEASLSGARLDPGMLTASLAIGALIGLTVLQLIRGRRRRGVPPP